ncbi:DUF6671 family protein [Evansella tamaricis]|uniref:DUF6671 domain-containing protein n=1 Tax=Evansella tamaricis TaxID=2069301 RepID=A0ABS6JEP6_9BACI|nr:DUF6671 family protein [Evansella tamaricis]MBU9712144.1 hypothetical protein [Evansella tamaricis]
MEKEIKKLYEGYSAVIATMHRKEQVIAPILNRELGLKLILPEDFNSDIFGTFTREVERKGDQIEAARQKIKSAFAKSELTIGIASEGSFGPHPVFPFSAFNRELVLFFDQEQDLEIAGYVANGDTNFAQKTVASLSEAKEFAESVGFPEHGVIVRVNETETDPNGMVKGIIDPKQLEYVVNSMLDMQKKKNSPLFEWKKKTMPTVFLETDMRAMYNPTRMKNIELATMDLVSKIKSICPKCSSPGYEVVEHKKGLRCECCDFPTADIYAHIYECKKCRYQEKVMFPYGKELADPAKCYICNP